MKRPLAIAAIALASLVLGGFISDAANWPNLFAENPEGELRVALPAAVTQTWFRPLSDYDNGGEPMDDALFDELMTALDVAMTGPETQADFGNEGNLHLTNFSNRLTVAEITDEQQERVSTYLDDLLEQYPEDRHMVEQRRILMRYDPSSADYMWPLLNEINLFDDADHLDPDGRPFEDRQVEEILARFDAMFRIPGVPIEDVEQDAMLPFFMVMRYLEMGTLTPEQTGQVAAYFEKLKEEYPDGAEFLDEKRYVVENLMPGKVAPNSIGNDIDGVEFALEEYRGNIVVLVFTGQWCGPCRGEYPYQRAMLQIYEDRGDPVVLLGVNSDPVLDTVHAVKEREALSYRTWWDGHVEDASTNGPIATQWKVEGWPQIYILDDLGVIRHSGERGGDIITAVDALLAEKRTRDYASSSRIQVLELEEEPEAGEEKEDGGNADGR